MQYTTPLLIAAVASVALVGCASTAPAVDPGAAAASPTVAAAPTSDAPSGSAAAPPATATPSAPVFPAGQPPRPGRQDAYPRSDGVPGLTAAVRAARHPGLQICDGDLVSLVTASGDLRGDGGEQYLVDTTCSLATSSSPDEVALYDVHGGTIARSAVLSEFTANRPDPSSYPYVWQGHTVVLAYDQDTSYRLIRLTPDGVVPGLVQPFR
ncbi:hypothetical protein ACTJKO_10895 [Curtobacterium sp. 22159]|uniref:hypothetical protein n=1 Tax=Curtobacterium sp. 22159 TaxID=3453882 RepID=UPI003F85A730